MFTLAESFNNHTHKSILNTPAAQVTLRKKKYVEWLNHRLYKKKKDKILQVPLDT